MTPLILASVLFVCQPTGFSDADTWICNGGPKVRAWGIDAPESYTPQNGPATRAMVQIIGGRELTCERRGTSWGRVVARCTLPDGTDVSEALVRSGWAQDCPSFSKGRYATFRPSNGPILPQRRASCEVKR